MDTNNDQREQDAARETRRHGRLVNNLPIFEDLVAALPRGVRHEVLSFATDVVAREGLDYEALGTPYCDGLGVVSDGSECRMRDGLAGAASIIHEYESDPRCGPILNYPMRGDPNTITNPAQLFTLTGPVKTISGDVLDKVEEHEHRLHALGVKVDRRYGYEMGRVIIVKWLLMLSILYNVPMVNSLDIKINGCHWRNGTCHIDTVFEHFNITSTDVSYDFLTGQWWPVVENMPIALWYTCLIVYNGAQVKTLDMFVYIMGKLNGLSRFITIFIAFLTSIWCWALKLAEDAVFQYAAKPGAIVDQEAALIVQNIASIFIFAAVVIFCLLYRYKNGLGFLLTSVIHCCYSGVVSAYRFGLTYFLFDFVKCFKRKMVWFRAGIESGGDKPHWSFFSSNLPLLEMSMNGSDLFTPKSPNALAIVVEVDTNVGPSLRLIGGCFRYGNFLVTANHVANHLLHSQSTPYVVPYCKGSLKLDRTRKVELPTSANILSEDNASFLDLCILPVDKDFFSRLGVSSLRPGPALWNSAVTSYGYREEKLQAASGSILRCRDIGAGRVRYTATTFGGWSGGPIMAGNRVVAVHLGTTENVNEGLDIEAVRFFVDMQTLTASENSDYLFWDKKYDVVRDREGRECDVEWTDFGGFTQDRVSGKRIAFSKHALAEYKSREDLEEMHPSEVQRYFADGGQSSRSTRKYFNDARESAEIVIPHDDVLNEHTAPLVKGPAPAITEDDGLFALSDTAPLVVRRKAEKPTRTPFYKGNTVEIEAAMDVESAVALGYDKEKFLFPLARDARQAAKDVEISMSAHLEMFDQARLNSKPPPAALLKRAMRLTMDMLAVNRYKMVVDPLSDENIMSLVNSARIDGAKSPGYPWIAEGYMSNAAVLSAHNIPKLVRENFDTAPPPTNVFGKMEPTKAAKIEKSMLRLIHGVGLIPMITCMAYFANFNDTMIKKYHTSPIQGGWSPGKKSDGEYFVKRHTKKKSKKGRKICSDDVKNWDYSAFKYILETCVDILISLAVRPSEMTVEEEKTWKRDARKVAMMQFQMGFRLPSGTVIDRTEANIMTSGTFLTFAINSIAMVLLDNMSKMQMGLTNKEIVDDFVLTVGGDDKINDAPADFDHNKYVSILRSWGFDVHGEEQHESIFGAEFFSWRFGKDPSGEFTWVPTRFSKHVDSLRGTKLEYVGDALISHMRNWVHSEPHFEWFKTVYLKLHERNAPGCTLERLVDREDIIHALYGYENAHTDRVEYHESSNPEDTMGLARFLEDSA